MNKFSKFNKELSTFSSVKPSIYLSPATGYRARCEFGISKNSYTMVKDNKKIYMDVSEIPHNSIQKIMPKLLKLINKSNILKSRLFQINFRSSGSHVLATMIYHKYLIDDWANEAQSIQAKFNNLSIIGRSKNQQIINDEENLKAICKIKNSNFKILQNDLVFFQPNFYLYPKMISFITSFLKDSKDLLELYCGCGSFTLPLASKFNKVFATENNRHAIKLLFKSIELNNISNIKTARLSDDETALALNKKRMFRRLKNIDLTSYNFSHILVDPPRAGLSKQTINLTKQFSNIIYISCNPETFFRDLKIMKRRVQSIGLFDQFANTDHLEVIAILK
tara:strand:- start:1209 stop:2216 length:1008 start_codon:yes stop_codon:yes gene_type:complete